MSWRLTDAERRYTNSEREVLAVVRAVQEVRWLIVKSPFAVLVYTDHKSLVDSITNTRETHDKIRRWDVLSGLPLEYRHRSNATKEIRIADGLSRLLPATQDPSLSENLETSQTFTPIGGT